MEASGCSASHPRQPQDAHQDDTSQARENMKKKTSEKSETVRDVVTLGKFLFFPSNRALSISSDSRAFVELFFLTNPIRLGMKSTGPQRSDHGVLVQPPCQGSIFTTKTSHTIPRTRNEVIQDQKSRNAPAKCIIKTRCLRMPYFA